MNILTNVLIAIALVSCLVVACPPNCHDCDPSGTICFACAHNYEANVFGSCQENKIDKCVIYGPTGECFNCQPTFRLEGEKCEKDFSGCIMPNSNDGTCFECGFSTTLRGGHCSGVINCEEEKQPCDKCKEGYQLDGGVCRDASEGCAEVRPSDGICMKCKKGYVQSGYECVSKKVKVPRCYIYNAEGKCKACKNGFNNFEDKCLLAKEIQTFLQAREKGTDHTFGFTEEGFVEGGKK